MTNLLTEPRVIKTTNRYKFPLRGGVELDVYRIPLDLLYYNEQNGRIATFISRYRAKNGEDITCLDITQRNKIIQQYIIESDEKRFNKTKLDIRKKGQQIPGIVLSDGRIIDGNRRFACLNSLYYEDGEPGFSYYEAVIIKGNVTDREIKELELEVTYADPKVEYNPIEKLVDVYNKIIKEKMFTVKQYASHTNQDEKTVEKMRVKALLMEEFLESINAPESFYIAKDFKLDGYLEEIQVKYNTLKKDKEDWKKTKIILNDYMLMNDNGSKNFRKFIDNLVIKNKKFDNFYDEYEDTSYAIHEKLDEGVEDEGEITTEFIRNNIRGDKVLNKKFNDIIENYTYISKINQSQKEPIELLRKINKQLSGLDKGVVSKLKGELKIEFLRELKEANKHIKEINYLTENGNE